MPLSRYHDGYRRNQGPELKDIPPEKLHPLAQVTGVIILWGNSNEGYEDSDSSDDEDTEDADQNASTEMVDEPKTPRKNPFDYSTMLARAMETPEVIPSDGKAKDAEKNGGEPSDGKSDDVQKNDGAEEDPPKAEVTQTMIQKISKFDIPETPSRKLLKSG